MSKRFEELDILKNRKIEKFFEKWDIDRYSRIAIIKGH